MKKTQFVISVFGLMLSLWGGSYLLHLSQGTWAAFPSLMTTVGGILVSVTGIVDSLS